jgi:hypothetical protein
MAPPDPPSLDPSGLPGIPDRQAAKVVVGIDLGTSASGFSYFIRPGAAGPAPAAGLPAGAEGLQQELLLQCSPAAVQPIQAMHR